MSDFVKVLTRKNSLRKQCQELSLADIEKILADLNEIIEERKGEEAEKQAELGARMAKIEEIRKQMEEAGLSLDDLQALKESGAGKRKVEAKYRVVDENGETHEWSGRGRTPVAFKDYFEKHGVSKEDTRIG